MFTDNIDAAEPTHKLVSRDLPDVEDWDEAGSVTVENRAMDVLMDHGTTVHLQLDPGHDQFDTVRRELGQVPDEERLFAQSTREFQASLPEDRALVESLLDIPAADTDAWTDRLFAIDELAVLADHSWVYRSVPHESHIREINARGHPELVDELNGLLTQVRGSAVVPFDGLVSWTTNDVTYELEWDALYRSREGSAVSYDLERLKRVRFLSPENRVRLDWRPASEESLLRRSVWRLLDSDAADPPRDVEISAGKAGEAIFDAFQRLRDDLDYDYETERSSRA